MNIFLYAIQMEKDGVKYLNHLAEQFQNTGFEDIFIKMANDKNRHCELLENVNLKSKHPEMLESKILTDAKNLFNTIQEEKKAFTFPVTEPGLYREALDIEKKCQKFYLIQSESTDEHPQKEIFHRLALEEGKYVQVLENLVDFVTTPDTWLENAEWRHEEAY